MKLLLVAPRTGAQWVKEGLQAFKRAPMAFFSLFMLSMSAMALLAQVPVIGGALAAAIGPATTLALMAATEHVYRTGQTAPTLNARPLSASLFLTALQAVRDRVRPLMVLGALYAVAVLLASGVATLLVGDAVSGAFGADGAPNPEVIQSGPFQLGMVLRLIVYVPVALAFWHAPALMHWHGVTPIKSLFFSVVTCFRNFGAMLVFGLVWMGVLLATSLVMTVVAALLSSVAGAAAVALMVAGSFVLSSMFFASAWFSFRDSFRAD